MKNIAASYEAEGEKEVKIARSKTEEGKEANTMHFSMTLNTSLLLTIILPNRQGSLKKQLEWCNVLKCIHQRRGGNTQGVLEISNLPLDQAAKQFSLLRHST
jgi:hypothetical protein